MLKGTFLSKHNPIYWKVSLIKKLLHPLLKAGRLGTFWRSIYRRHAHGRLEQGQIEWLVRAKQQKGMKNGNIARALGISERGG